MVETRNADFYQKTTSKYTKNMNPIDTHLIKDTRKRTAKRNKEHEVESPYIWLAIPVLLISWILIRWIIG